MVELLAPAGNFDALRAAVESGADAVYLAGEKFGARAFADNFSRETLIEAVKFAHCSSIFATVNSAKKLLKKTLPKMACTMAL